MYCDYGGDGLVDDSILIILPGGSSILGDIIVWGEPLPQIEHECDFDEDCQIGKCYETLQFDNAGRKCIISAAHLKDEPAKVIQTSTYSGSICKLIGPDKAIDGNTDGNFNHGCSISSTKPEYSPKWTITLTKNYFIYGIKVWRRTDTYLKQLNGVYITVYDKSETSVKEYGPLNYVYSDSPLHIQIPVQTNGNHVDVY